MSKSNKPATAPMTALIDVQDAADRLFASTTALVAKFTQSVNHTKNNQMLSVEQQNVVLHNDVQRFTGLLAAALKTHAEQVNRTIHAATETIKVLP